MSDCTHTDTPHYARPDAKLRGTLGHHPESLLCRLLSTNTYKYTHLAHSHGHCVRAWNTPSPALGLCV